MASSQRTLQLEATVVIGNSPRIFKRPRRISENFIPRVLGVVNLLYRVRIWIFIWVEDLKAFPG